MKYWPLIWSALVRKPTEGVLTFLAVAAGFTLLAMMIGMNLTTRDILAHSPANRLIVDTRFFNPNAEGFPLAMGTPLAHVEGVRGIAAYRWLGGYHVDPHQSLGIRMVDADMPAMWSPGPVNAVQWGKLFATPNGVLASVKSAAKWGIKTGDTFTITTQSASRADGGTSWEFHVVGVVPDDPNLSGTIGFMLGNSLYLENTAPLEQRGTGYYYYVALKNPEEAVKVSQRIDDLYANSSTATMTFQERLNVLSRTSRGFDTISMTLAIGGAGFVMVLLLTANAITRSVRERVPEFAILKTLGFRGIHLMVLVFVETTIPCVLGALLGTQLAAVLNHWSAHLLPQSLARLPITALPMAPVLSVAVVLSVLLALGSCAVPMLRLQRLSVTDALAGR